MFLRDSPCHQGSLSAKTGAKSHKVETIQVISVRPLTCVTLVTSKRYIWDHTFTFVVMTIVESVSDWSGCLYSICWPISVSRSNRLSLSSQKATGVGKLGPLAPLQGRVTWSSTHKYGDCHGYNSQAKAPWRILCHICRCIARRSLTGLNYNRAYFS